MKNTFNIKTASIVGAVILVVFGAVWFSFKGIPNRAYVMEENISESRSNLTVQEKKRNDKVVNLVDTIKNYDNYEATTLENITKARVSASEGNIEEAKVAIKAVTEAYPELKSQDNYKTLMVELSLLEEQVSQYRESYNRQVSDYNRYVRTFPNNALLPMTGYEIQTYEKITFEGYETLTEIWE